MFETQIPVCSIVLVLTVTKYKFYLNLTKMIFLYRKWALEPSCLFLGV